MTWTDERVEELKRLWAEGHSASEIGRRLRITRNGVLGKVHRLKLPGRKVETRKRDSVIRLPRSTRPKRQNCGHGGQRPKKQQAPKPVVAPIPEPLMIDLMSKADSQCSFPIGHVGEPGFGFCGHPATHGPYCAGHHRLTHEAAPRPNMLGIAA